VSAARKNLHSLASHHEAHRDLPPVRPLHVIGGLVVVMLGVLVVFWPAVHNQFVDWDDTSNFINNPDYRGLAWSNLRWMFTTVHMGHYQPLTWMTLGMDSIWGEVLFGNRLDPRPYHFTNVLLHALNSGLVFLLALRLMRVRFEGQNNSGLLVLGAMIAALLFGIHPLRVESVAWATERRDLLSGFFLLLCVLSYLRYVRSSQNRIAWYALTLFLFLCSLISKVIGVTLPVALLALDIYPLRRLLVPGEPRDSRHVWRIILEKLPMFALAAVFSAIASILQGTHNWLIPLDRHGPAARVVQSFYGLAFYMFKSIAPVNLLPLYPLDMPLDIGQARFVLAITVVVIVGTLLVVFRTRVPAFCTAIFIYVITLLPVLGLVQNGPQLVADRYSYLSTIGLAIVTGGGIVWLGLRKSQRVLNAALVFSCVAIAVLGAAAWRQVHIWRSTETLWTYTALHDDSNAFAQNGYGYVLLQRGELDAAAARFRKSIQLLPANSKAHGNLWTTLQRQGNTDALIAAWEHAEKVSDAAYEAHYNHAVYLMGQKNYAQAAAHLKEAETRCPPAAQFNGYRARIRTNLGISLNAQGDREAAAAAYRAAIAADNSLFEAHYNFGLLLRDMGQRDQAIAELNIALALRPEHAGAGAALQALRR
jgi:tetratricopeptide (TPR) repeat protein